MIDVHAAVSSKDNWIFILIEVKIIEYYFDEDSFILIIYYFILIVLLWSVMTSIDKVGAFNIKPLCIKKK